MEVEQDVNITNLLEFLDQEMSDHSYIIQNVYLFGSRLFGYAKPTSDWDFICTVKGNYYAGPKLIEKGHLNVNLFHEDYFQFLLDENVIWIIMTLFFPSSHIWQETRKFSYVFRKERLRKVALMDCLHNFNKAKRAWKEQNYSKARKNLVHGLRWLEFAEQMANNNGNIIDLFAANKWWYEISENQSLDWKEYENRYKPIYTEKMQLISHLLKPILLNKKIHVENQLEVVEFIHEYGLDALCRELSMIVRRHSQFTNLVMLLCDGMNSPLEEKVVQQGHQLILDESQGYKVVAKGYQVFFNYGDKLASQIDWNSAKIYEKVDGALAIVYWYNGKWQVASEETPDGSDEVIQLLTEDKLYYYSKRPCYNAWKFFDDEMKAEKNNAVFLKNESVNIEQAQKKVNFKDLFWDVFNKSNYKLPEEDTGEIYLFELSSERQQLIIARGKPLSSASSATDRYEDRLVLHGVRNAITCEEKAIEPIAEKYGWKQVESYQFDNIEQIQDAALNLNPLEYLGYVIVDKDFKRVKIKSPQYVALKKLCWFSEDENRNKKLMLEIIRSNPHIDFLKRFPKWEELYTSVKREYDEFCNYINAVYNALIGETDQQTWRDKVTLTEFPKVLFDLKSRNLTIEQYLARVDYGRLERLFKERKVAHS